MAPEGRQHALIARLDVEVRHLKLVLAVAAPDRREPAARGDVHDVVRVRHGERRRRGGVVCDQPHALIAQVLQHDLRRRARRRDEPHRQRHSVGDRDVRDAHAVGRDARVRGPRGERRLRTARRAQHERAARLQHDQAPSARSEREARVGDLHRARHAPDELGDRAARAGIRADREHVAVPAREPLLRDGLTVDGRVDVKAVVRGRRGRALEAPVRIDHGRVLRAGARAADHTEHRQNAESAHHRLLEGRASAAVCYGVHRHTPPSQYEEPPQSWVAAQL